MATGRSDTLSTSLLSGHEAGPQHPILAPPLLLQRTLLTSLKQAAQGRGHSFLQCPQSVPARPKPAETHPQEPEGHAALGPAGTGLEFQLRSLLGDLGRVTWMESWFLYPE